MLENDKCFAVYETENGKKFCKISGNECLLKDPNYNDCQKYVMGNSDYIEEDH